MRLKSLRLSCVSSILLAGLASPLPDASAADGVKDLNRLFTDPESRTRMDAARKGDPVFENIEAEQTTNKIRVDGVVIRENGDNVVWVNGESSLNSSNAGGAHVRTRQVDRRDYRVPVRVDDKTVRLKPGQVWTGESGKVKDDY